MFLYFVEGQLPFGQFVVIEWLVGEARKEAQISGAGGGGIFENIDKRLVYKRWNIVLHKSWFVRVSDICRQTFCRRQSSDFELDGEKGVIFDNGRFLTQFWLFPASESSMDTGRVVSRFVARNKVMRTFILHILFVLLHHFDRI